MDRRQDKELHCLPPRACPSVHWPANGRSIRSVCVGTNNRPDSHVSQPPKGLFCNVTSLPPPTASGGREATNDHPISRLQEREREKRWTCLVGRGAARDLRAKVRSPLLWPQQQQRRQQQQQEPWGWDSPLPSSPIPTPTDDPTTPTRDSNFQEFRKGFS